MKQTGILGGSFNPPHMGHLHLAESIYDALHLDEVLLIPAKQPPHKSSAAYARAEDRLAMCRLLAEAHPWLRAEEYELQQERISYTSYTVQYFKEKFPDTKFWLMVGGDMLTYFTKWYRWQDILGYVSLAAIAREPGELEKLRETAENLRQYGEISVVNVESYPISSTKIREMARKNSDYSCYLPEKIVQYIKKRNLYTGSDQDVSGER